MPGFVVNFISQQSCTQKYTPAVRKAHFAPCTAENPSGNFVRAWYFHVFASVAKQSIFKNGLETMDCFVATLLAKTGANGLLRSLRFSQRRGQMDCFVATLLAKTGANGLLRRYVSRKDGGKWIASSLRSSQRRGAHCIRTLPL